MGRLAPPPGARVQRYRQKQGNIPYTSGVATPLPISQTDYLTSIDVMANQTLVNGATAPVLAAGWGAYAALAGGVQVKVNGGRIPFSMPGYHAAVFNEIWNKDYVDSMAALPNVVSVTNQWKNHLRIPLSVDPLTEKGAFYTGDTSLYLSVVLNMSAVTVLATTVNGAVIGGSWDIWSEKFNAPPPDEPGGWLDEITYYHQAELYGTFTLQNGVTSITLETDQDYQRIVLIFYTGNDTDNTFAPADALYTTIDAVVNDKFHIFDTVDEQTYRFEMLQSQYLLPKAGTCAIDFMRLYNSRRDVLPTDANLAKRFQLKIAASAANKVDVITETVMDSQFAERWIRSAAAKAAARAAAAGRAA
jgi:hypothetical protein